MLKGEKGIDKLTAIDKSHPFDALTIDDRWVQ